MGDIQKGITLTQPFATLVAMGAKNFETREWNTDYRGWVLIHAGKSLDYVGGEMGLRRLCGKEPFASHIPAPQALPLGQVVAVARLAAVFQVSYARFAHGLPIVESEPIDAGVAPPVITVNEYWFGNYQTGRFIFALKDITPLAPRPWRGGQGLWDASAFPYSLSEAQVDRALGISDGEAATP